MIDRLKRDLADVIEFAQILLAFALALMFGMLDLLTTKGKR